MQLSTQFNFDDPEDCGRIGKKSLFPSVLCISYNLQTARFRTPKYKIL